MKAYETLLRHVLWPAYEGGLRRRETPRHMRRYERDQWLALEEIQALQFQRLTRLLDWCYREVPYYRRRWEALGIAPRDIRSMADFGALPVLTKADIRENAEELKATSLKDALQYKATGGSTGEPLRFGFTRESNDRRVAVMWRGYRWAGSRMGRRTLFLWGGAVGHPSAARRLKDRVYNAVFARCMLDSFHMSEGNMASYADAIDTWRPEVIVGYVGPLVRLAEWLLAHGRQVARPVSVIGAAEALHPFQRELIERAFRAPAYNTYGCREFMLIASECEHRQGLHVNADHLVVETLHDGVPTSTGSGEVAVDPTDVLERVKARRLDRSGQLALVAALEAWKDAGFGEDGDATDPERVAVALASGIGGVQTLLSNYDALKEKGPRRVSPLAIPMLMPNGPAASIGLTIGAKAAVHTPVRMSGQYNQRVRHRYAPPWGLDAVPTATAGHRRARRVIV